MSVELFGYDTTDAEKLVIAWLTPVGYRVAIERKSGDPLPFVIVNELVATTDEQLVSAYPLVSIHILGSTKAQTAATATQIDRRMMLLVRDPLQDITLADASVANIEWAEVVERPSWRYYSDTVSQKIGRYRFGQPFVNAA